MVTFREPFKRHKRRALPDVEREIRQLVTSLRRNNKLDEWDENVQQLREFVIEVRTRNAPPEEEEKLGYLEIHLKPYNIILNDHITIN